MCITPIHKTHQKTQNKTKTNIKKENVEQLSEPTPKLPF